MTSIALVVIGKNDIINLRKIYSDSYVNSIESYFRERIYVDSGSCDGSAEFMKSIGFMVYVLTADSFKSAAAGRFVGAKEASSDYLVFVDSDMEIKGCSSFQEQLAKAKTHGFQGIVGRVTDVYPNGIKRVRIRKLNKESEASSFGGFVILERASLMSVGNWDPFVPANEELELHARFLKAGFRVKLTNEFEVNHFTIATNPLAEVFSLYFPVRPSRYGAYGYALAASIRKGSLFSLVKLSYEVYLFLLLLILAPLFYNNLSLLVLLLTAYVWLVRVRRSVKYLIVPPGVLVSFMYGLIKYRPGKICYEKI